MKEIVYVLVLIAIAMVLLCVRVILKKNGRFSSHDVGQSKAMQERGIGCTRSQDRQAQRPNPRKLQVKDL